MGGNDKTPETGVSGVFVGWTTGLEPAATGTTSRCSTN